MWEHAAYVWPFRWPCVHGNLKSEWHLSLNATFQFALQCVEMQIGPPCIAFDRHLALELLARFGVNHLERSSCAHRFHDHLGGAFEVVEVIECLSNTLSDDNNAMVGMEQYFFVAHHLAEPVALRFVEHEAVELRIVRDVLIEAKAILVAHLEASIL